MCYAKDTKTGNLFCKAVKFGLLINLLRPSGQYTYREVLKQKLLHCAHKVESCVSFVTTNNHLFPILTPTIMPLKEADCVLCEV